MAVTYQIAGPGATSHLHKHHRLHVWLGTAAFLFAGIVILGIIGALSGPPKPCHASCGFKPPPTSPPLSVPSSYHSSALGFTIPYDRNYAGSPTSQTSNSIAWHFALRSGGYFQVRFSGSRERFASSGDLVNRLQRSDFSQFSPVYTMPEAEVGYVPGSGEIYQGVWSPLVGSASPERVAIIAAVDKGVGVSMECEGPQVTDNGAHPNPAQLGIADYFCDQMLNGLTWSGQKPH